MPKLSSPKELLKHPNAYIALQKGLGADRLRYRAIDALDLKPGEVVIDVGCGPAYYYPKLPQPITYFGFDTDPGYIEWSTQRFGRPGTTFTCGIFDAGVAAELPRADAVMLLGLLHHLDDAQCDDLLGLAAAVLNPGGRVVAVDVCYTEGQGRVSRWMSDNDRGEYVRHTSVFEEMARKHFGVVRTELLETVERVPTALWQMLMSQPVA